MSDPIFESIAVIGVGLLGASVALSTRDTGAATDIRLFDTDGTVRARAAELELGTVYAFIDKAVEGADCVILCVPVGAMGAVGQEIAPHLKAGAIVTDVGSVKSSVAKALQSSVGAGVHLIPGHPIAGTEKSGPDAGFASLFEGAWHILTPLDDVPGQSYADAVEILAQFWGRLGARVEVMDAARHDRVLAITSHLPHLIAYNIVSTAYDMETIEEGEVVKYSAGGFRDFTRIASSDPTMWRDVFLNNKDAVLECLGRFSEDLAALQRAIRWGNGDMLMKEFERARGIRQAIIDAGLDSEAVNFGRNDPLNPSEDDA